VSNKCGRDCHSTVDILVAVWHYEQPMLVASWHLSSFVWIYIMSGCYAYYVTGISNFLVCNNKIGRILSKCWWHITSCSDGPDTRRKSQVFQTPPALDAAINIIVLSRLHRGIQSVMEMLASVEWPLHITKCY